MSNPYEYREVKAPDALGGGYRDGPILEHLSDLSREGWNVCAAWHSEYGTTYVLRRATDV